MISTINSLTWQLQTPIHTKEHTNFSSVGYRWLQQLSEMRGRVLFDEGRRPGFQLADGTFADADFLDTYAYHILAHSSNCIVGSLRVIPLINAPTCLTELLLGHQEFDQLLQQIGSTRVQTCEGSRWIVAPEHRGRLGLNLLVGGIALCRYLGLKRVIVMAGTRDGQDRLLIHAGFQSVPGLGLRDAPMYDDQLRILYLDVFQEPNSLIAGLLKKMTKLVEGQFCDHTAELAVRDELLQAS